MRLIADQDNRAKFNDTAKQFRFGLAAGLTKTAKQGQATVVAVMKKEFVLRGRWYEQSNKFGIRITPARKNSRIMEAAIHTTAPWLTLQESGGIKKPHQRSALTVPLPATRPPGSPKKIPRLHRQKLKQKGSFILKVGTTALLAVRKKFKRKVKGVKSRLDFFYIFERQVRIRRRPFWREPIEKGLQRRLHSNIAAALNAAYKRRP